MHEGTKTSFFLERCCFASVFSAEISTHNKFLQYQIGLYSNNSVENLCNLFICKRKSKRERERTNLHLLPQKKLSPASRGLLSHFPSSVMSERTCCWVLGSPFFSSDGGGGEGERELMRRGGGIWTGGEKGIPPLPPPIMPPRRPTTTTARTYGGCTKRENGTECTRKRKGVAGTEKKRISNW